VVAPIPEPTAKDYVLSHHYSGTYPASVARYGLYLGDPADGDLVGVAVFSVPVSQAVITKVFPDLDHSNACELGRLVCEGGPARHGSPRAPANAESFFVARCLEQLADAGYRGVVTFADPVPRRLGDGTLVMPGHVGVVYSATNFAYLGRGTARSVILLPDGRTLSERAAQKVRAGERGHEYVERRLCALGARVPRAGEAMGAWLADALETVGATRLRHRGNHRYGLAIGPTRSERRAVRIALDPLPYPKQVDVPQPVLPTAPTRRRPSAARRSSPVA